MIEWRSKILRLILMFEMAQLLKGTMIYETKTC